jgi:starch synthase
LEFHGAVSLLKAGIQEADWLSTVSPRYAQEIQTPEHGFRMDGLLRARSGSLSGILNGVDYSAWNPETDPLIAENYSWRNMEGKAACKAALLREFGLDNEAARSRPLIGIVSRFAEQKGFDLVAQVYHELAAEDVTILALGTGDYRIESMFWSMERDYGSKVKAYLGYSEPLAHRITAGADLFLMPSRYEPCGLNQMYSLRYGTLPVVRATGGLDDTIDSETGFKFWGYQGWDLLLAVRHALSVYADQDRWQVMMRTAMERDYGWHRSAGQYVQLYDKLAGA